MEINYKGLTLVYSVIYDYDALGNEQVYFSIDEIYHENDTKHQFDLTDILFETALAVRPQDFWYDVESFIHRVRFDAKTER